MIKKKSRRNRILPVFLLSGCLLTGNLQPVQALEQQNQDSLVMAEGTEAADTLQADQLSDLTVSANAWQTDQVSDPIVSADAQQTDQVSDPTVSTDARQADQPSDPTVSAEPFQTDQSLDIADSSDPVNGEIGVETSDPAMQSPPASSMPENAMILLTETASGETTGIEPSPFYAEGNTETEVSAGGITDDLEQLSGEPGQVLFQEGTAADSPIFTSATATGEDSLSPILFQDSSAGIAQDAAAAASIITGDAETGDAAGDQTQTTDDNGDPAETLSMEDGPTGDLIELPDPEPARRANLRFLEMVSAASSYRTPDLPPVREQDPTGMCWAFSTTSCMEIYLLKNGLGAYDLSEEHLAWFLVNRQNDPLNHTAGDHNNASYHFRSSGNQILAALGLSTWSGLDLEERAPLGVTGTGATLRQTDPTVSPSQAYETSVYLTEAVFASNTGEYKNMIETYGALGVSLCYDSQYLNKCTFNGRETYAYSMPYNKNVTHAVTLVGWDDSFPASNFGSNAGVQTDGAYLARNSWGSDWGDEGYFYISYECKTLKNAVAFAGTTNPTWKNNYFYDGTTSLITTEEIVPSSSNGGITAIANVFEATAGNGLAESLGEVVVTDYRGGGSYGVQVYTHLTDRSDPTSGIPAFDTPAVYSSAYAGVHTFTLPSEIYITQGSCFSVVITAAGNNSILLMTESSGSSGNGELVWEAQTDRQQSFVLNGSSGQWLDLAEGSTPSCARIKAHTRTLSQPASLRMSAPKTSLTTGESATVKIFVSGGLPIGKFKAMIGTGNKAVAVVDGSGTVTGMGVGTTEITYRILGTSLQCSLSFTLSDKSDASADSDPLDPAGSLTPSDGEVQITVNLPDQEKNPPLAPAGLTALPVNYKKIHIQWEPSSEAEGYELYRKTGSSKWQCCAELSGTVTAWNDTDVILGKKYRYKVRAWKTDDGSRLRGAFSSVVKSAPVLNAPSKLTAASRSSGIRLSWKKVSGAKGYVIYRKVKGGKYKKVATITSGSTRKWTDKNTKKGVKYQYRIRAYRKSSGKNRYSEYTYSNVIKRK